MSVMACYERVEQMAWNSPASISESVLVGKTQRRRMLCCTFGREHAIADEASAHGTRYAETVVPPSISKFDAGTLTHKFTHRLRFLQSFSATWQPP